MQAEDPTGFLAFLVTLGPVAKEAVDHVLIATPLHMNHINNPLFQSPELSLLSQDYEAGLNSIYLRASTTHNKRLGHNTDPG